MFLVCSPFNEILVVNLPKIINTPAGWAGWAGDGVVMTNSKVNMTVLCHTGPLSHMGCMYVQP